MTLDSSKCSTRICGQDYESKSVKEHADVYQYVVTGMDAVNAAIEAAQEA